MWVSVGELDFGIDWEIFLGNCICMVFGAWLSVYFYFIFIFSFKLWQEIRSNIHYRLQYRIGSKYNFLTSAFQILQL